LIFLSNGTTLMQSNLTGLYIYVKCKINFKEHTYQRNSLYIGRKTNFSSIIEWTTFWERDSSMRGVSKFQNPPKCCSIFVGEMMEFFTHEELWSKEQLRSLLHFLSTFPQRKKMWAHANWTCRRLDFFWSGSELCAPNIFKSEKWKNLLRRIIIQNSICKKEEESDS
jgi:hypothetical protein